MKKLRNVPWKKKEDELLKKYFTSSPWNKLFKILKGRTRGAIYQHAARDLRLKRLNPEKMPYSEKEKKIIRKCYGVLPKEELMKMLPGRKWDLVGVFARTSLGLRREHLRKWSEEELKMLREHGASSPWPLILKLLPKRNRGAISMQCFKMGIKRASLHFWSRQDEAFLIQAAKESSGIKSRAELKTFQEDIVKKLGRTIDAVQEKMRQLGLNWNCPTTRKGFHLQTNVQEDERWLENLKTQR